MTRGPFRRGNANSLVHGRPRGFNSGAPVLTLPQQIIAVYAAAAWTVHALFLARLDDVTLVDTDKVSLWLNHGIGSDAVQGTAARRPVWNATGLNGLPTLVFASDDLKTGTDLDLQADSALALTVLFKDTQTAIRNPAEIGRVAGGEEGANITTNISSAGTLSMVAFDVVQPIARSLASFPMASPASVTGTWDSARAAEECEIRHGGSNITDTYGSNANSAGFIDDVYPLSIGSLTDGNGAILGSVSACVLASGSTAVPVAAVAEVEALLDGGWGL